MRKSTLVRVCVGMLAVALVAAPGHGSVIVFLSPVTTIGGGAVVGNPSLTGGSAVTIGDEFSLGVWVTAPSGLTINGLGLDIVETAGILDANTTPGTWRDPNLSMAVLEAGIFFNRWNKVTPPELDVSGTELFIGSNAIGVSENGLEGGALRALDGNYDSAVTSDGAFLHAIITMKAIAVGTTHLFFKVGEKKIGYDPDTDPNVNFGTGDAVISREVTGNQSSLADATIQVIIPEPTTLGLLALGGLGAVFRRRRRT